MNRVGKDAMPVSPMELARNGEATETVTSEFILKPTGSIYA